MFKSVAVFGVGKLFSEKKDAIKELYDIRIFLDNSINVGSYEIIDGIKCINPNDFDFSTEYIVVCSMKISEVVSQIFSLTNKNIKYIFAQCIKPDAEIKKILAFGGLDVTDGSVYFASDKLSCRHKLTNFNDVFVVLDDIERYNNPYFELIDNLPLQPINKKYAQGRGKSIVRYYIEQFLSKNAFYIKDDVLEVGDRRYTEKFYSDKIKNSYCISIKNAEDTVYGNLETGEGIAEEFIDCAIITQVIPFIYNLDAAANNLVKMLKPGGVALVTVHGISQTINLEHDTCGDFWRFTDMSLTQLFKSCSLVDTVAIEEYGNIKAAVGFLYGLSAEDIGEQDLDFVDKDYPVLLAAVVKKKTDE